MSGHVINFVAQLWKVETRRDGGGRIILDFGADALPAILEIQKLNAVGETSIALACVPYRNDQTAKHNDESVDPETGEIIMHRDHLD